MEGANIEGNGAEIGHSNTREGSDFKDGGDHDEDRDEICYRLGLHGHEHYFREQERDGELDSGI